MVLFAVSENESNRNSITSTTTPIGAAAPRNSFATPRESVDARPCPDCGNRRHSRLPSTLSNVRSTTPSSMTLNDESVEEKEKRQMSDSSSTLIVPIKTRSRPDSLVLKNEIVETPPLSSRTSFASLPRFLPHPAVRPHRSNSVWATKSTDQINLGTEPTPPGTPRLPPEMTSGMSPWHERVFVFTVCLAQLFSLAGLAQSFAPLLVISESFGVHDPGQMSWYTAAYSMTLGTFILPAGRLGDMFGHKKIFIIGWTWFALWSLITGFSHLGGPIMLSACRGMQGIGPALLIPNGIALIGRTFPIGMKRAVSIAIFGGCGPVGVTLGVVFSALFAELVWWPWSFWAMAIACAFAGILTFVVIPADAIPSSKSSREQFDLLGSFTGVTGLILINFALNEAPLEGWDHVYIPVLLGVGFLLMVAFVYIELYVATKPIVPLRGLHRDAAFTLACISAGWASHGIWSYYLYLFIEGVRGHSSLEAASQTWPVAPIGFLAALAVPWILRKIRVPYLMSLAMVFFAVCIILLVTAPPDQTYYAQTMVSILIAPFAMNWSFPSGTILMSNAVSKQHQGIAASLIATAVNYSIATGLGIAGTLERYLVPQHGVVTGFRDAWWLGIAFALLGFVISLYFIWQSSKSAAAKKS